MVTSENGWTKTDLLVVSCLAEIDSSASCQDAGMGMAGASGIYGSEARFVPQMLTKAVSAPAVLKA